MVLDRYTAERRRFYRLLGVNEVSVGLPVGSTDDAEARTQARSSPLDTDRPDGQTNITVDS